MSDDETPDEQLNLSEEDSSAELKNVANRFAACLPYSIEGESPEMYKLLEKILLRITQTAHCKNWDGLLGWDSMLGYWGMLKYPIPKPHRIALARLYFSLASQPALPITVIASLLTRFRVLVRNNTDKKRLTIEDLRLPWKPVYEMLKRDLFLTRRQFEYTQLTWYMGYAGEVAGRFFHPACVVEMLEEFVPQINGISIDAILATQYYMVTFLPRSHPTYLPMMFNLWESVNSYMYDDRMLDWLASLTELHLDPTVSDPARIAAIPDDACDGRPEATWSPQPEYDASVPWPGLYKDVGIFSEHEFQHIMCKCLASFEISMADHGSLTTGPSADLASRFELDRLNKPAWRITSLAQIVVYSMAPDGTPPPPNSTIPTPGASGANTPSLGSGPLGGYLAAPLRKGALPIRTYLGGSKALDALSRLIASTESFFHPNNSGEWTNDLSSFIKAVVYEFNKRFHDEQDPECKTPPNRRLTKLMRRELVKCLRTVALLAMFSEDPKTTANIQLCLKSMCVMEPDLILHPIIERALPALEALEETQRTIAVIKALGAVVPSIVCRDVYYPGAKHLAPILGLLIPGIDLNDPLKTICTTAFLLETSQYIMFADLSNEDEDTETLEAPAIIVDGAAEDEFPRLSDAEEDVLLKQTTGSFADWVSSFIRQIFQLLENLPEEGGPSETTVVDSVMDCCAQICAHLSEPLFDLALDMVYTYASTNVRANAVRAIDQLVQCFAASNSGKAIAKFLPLSIERIKSELEHGASSVRTTWVSSPLPSDTTLHWNIAIIRGVLLNDGKAILKHSEEIMSIITLLHEKTFSKRGYYWTGRLVSTLMYSITHTYPLEQRFVNPSTWDSPDFKKNSHKYWGKVFTADEVEVSWHVPDEQEIEFALRFLRDVIVPTLTILESLLKTKVRDEIWRNDFCRHLNLVAEFWSGLPTFLQQFPDFKENSAQLAEWLNDIEEMVTFATPIKSSFCLTDPEDTRYQLVDSVRRQFGAFLHDASVSLREQGEENTVDAVSILLTAIRVYFVEYGDSGDGYAANGDQLSTDRGIARQYGGQKVWPRRVHVRRARYYHAGRLYWNTLERRRGPLENTLVDDCVEWALWSYPQTRITAQNLLQTLCYAYDGIRRRVIPTLYKALEPGTDDDRMKGALWTLNAAPFDKPLLAGELLMTLFACQANEKPSIQDCVGDVSENCLSAFLEPNYLSLATDLPAVQHANGVLRELLVVEDEEAENDVLLRCSTKLTEKTDLENEAILKLVTDILAIATSPQTHWKYSILAIRSLRTLVRVDAPVTAPHLRYFLEKTYDNDSTMRYYATRAAMKCLRNIKLRTLSAGLSQLALNKHQNPLKERVPVEKSHATTAELLAGYRKPVNVADKSPVFLDDLPQGWAAHSGTMVLYRPPDDSRSPLQLWEPESLAAIGALREVASGDFWKSLATRLSEENHEDEVTRDNASLIKSVFQLLEDEPLPLFKTTLESLIADPDKDKQRAAAELLAGVIGGSKHWPTDKQQELWQWMQPLIEKTFSQTIQTESLAVWTSFIEYIFYRKDPRRVQPLVDYLTRSFHELDYNGESSFEAAKLLTLYEAFHDEMGWKFRAWADDILARVWSDLQLSDHDEVRAHAGKLIFVCGNLKWTPKTTVPTTEAFVNENRDSDIMGARGVHLATQVDDLLEKFPVWREARSPGPRAFQSTYDRVGVTVCKWLSRAIHEVQAVQAFDYILPLMPEIFRFTEVNDNDELVSHAVLLLVRMCGVTPPRPLVNQLLDAIFQAIETSPSWKVRLQALPIVQVFFFRQLPLISDARATEIMEVLCKCLDDENVEVREMAARTLSGILRLSPKRSVITLKDRFVRLVKSSRIPARQSPEFARAVRTRHCAILGLCALVESSPYTVQAWTPEILCGVLAEHTFDPAPISTTVSKCASNFKKTHADTWHEDCKRFNEEQLSALSTLIMGSSYYA